MAISALPCNRLRKTEAKMRGNGRIQMPHAFAALLCTGRRSPGAHAQIGVQNHGTTNAVRAAINVRVQVKTFTNGHFSGQIGASAAQPRMGSFEAAHFVRLHRAAPRPHGDHAHDQAFFSHARALYIEVGVSRCDAPSTSDTREL